MSGYSLYNGYHNIGNWYRVRFELLELEFMLTVEGGCRGKDITDKSTTLPLEIGTF